jgi:hypothetical protein
MSDEEKKDNPEMSPEEQAAIRGDMFKNFGESAEKILAEIWPS